MVLTRTNNAGAAGMFRKMLKPRDIFFHDGKALRRVRIGTGLQAAALGLCVAILAWSVFAAAQLSAVTAAPRPADVIAMEREVRAMQADVALIKEAAARRLLLTEREVRRLGLDP